MNVAGWVDENLRRFGDHDAVIDGDRVWTSLALHDRACRLASAFVAAGIQPGDRILLLLPNGADMFVAFEAVLRCGGVAVPLYAGESANAIESYVALSRPAGIVTTRTLVKVIGAAARTIPVRLATGVDDATESWSSFEHLIESQEPLATVVPRGPDDLAVICYTSGTSGSPKGVVHTHGSVFARHGGSKPRRVPGRMLIALPLNSLGAGMLTGRLAHQWTEILLDKFEPRLFLSAIERHRVSTLVMMPSMGEALVALPDLDRYDLSALRYVGFTGAHVPAALLTKLAEVLPVAPAVAYGMTETGGAVAASGLSSKRGSAGHIAKHVDVRIVGDDGIEVVDGHIGEIVVRTPWMGTGYFGQPDETAAAFADGWLWTGDLGFIDEDRELFIVGRRKDLIIQGGVKIHPHDIAEVIRQLPGVKECAVVGVPHALLGEEVAACLVRLSDADLTEDHVLAHCRLHLEPRKVPARVRFCEELPKTANGKVRLQDLRDQLVIEDGAINETPLVKRLGSAVPAERFSLLREAVERELRRVIPVEARGSTAALSHSDLTFGEIGLDSLGMAQFAHLLGAVLGRRIQPTLFFSHPTVEALCHHLMAIILGLPTETPPVAARHGHVVPTRQPIAIVGFGCRLPAGTDTPEKYWSMLQQGVDATAEIRRWDMSALFDPVRGTPGTTYTRRAALLDDVDMFDADFFGITSREAERLDPQHRLVLEVAWEAIENAGYNPRGLSERTTAGVFLGIGGASAAGGSGFGAPPSMAVARLCHVLDLRGPAVAVDTSCSSSLTAIHYAVQSLRLGECDVAVAGGVQLVGSARSFVALCEAGLLSSDGRCKAFAADADGFGRGEGCVMFLLKRLDLAQADGDRVIAVIRGSAVRHDGRSASLTAPNGRAQQQVIRAALADATATPDEIDYLEAHGTGTALGDPTEIEAALAVFGDRTRPLVIGSVKTNLGHLESAAGAAGVMKVALALEHRKIPAHLHCHVLNPLLARSASKFVIPQTTTTWPRATDRLRLAGVTSMGLSGTNVHVVLEEAPVVNRARDNADAAASTPQLLCLSARTATALRKQAEQFTEHLANVPTDGFADHCFTANVGRAHFAHRLSVVATSPLAAQQQLAAYARGASGGVREGSSGRRPKVAFAFTGIGTQYVGMGRQLCETEPVFRRALERCADILQPLLPRPLLDALYTAPSDETPLDRRLDEMAIGQPALFAFEWSLCQLWKAWGVVPEVVLGHSVGECVAACVAGLITLEDGLKLTAARGRLMQSLPAGGAMVSCAADSERVRAALDNQTSVSIAAVNGARSVVIAGARDALATVTHRLEANGIETRWLTVPRACHSLLMDPILPEFEQVARELAYTPPGLTLVSTLLGRRASFDELSQPEYWRRQVRESVRFADGIAALVAEGCDVVVEIGPQAVLTALARETLDKKNERCRWLPSVRAKRSDRAQMIETLAELYVEGLDPEWDGVYTEPRRRTALPTYPFERQHHRSGITDASHGSRRADGAPHRGGAQRRAGYEEKASSNRDPQWFVETVRRQLSEVLGRPPKSLPADSNCLDLGMDSLGVVDVVGAIGRMTGIACTPADFIARPTVAGFAAFLHRRVPSTQGEPIPPTSSSPLVVLNGKGSRTPIFCMHPSGGQVTAYLRLRALLGDDHPLYALQSRALDDPGSEFASIESMGADYATIVHRAQPVGPYRLIGWSMGGLIAHAVAGELERRGASVELVGLIDTIVTRATSQEGPVLGELEFVLAAIIGEVQPALAPHSLITSGLGEAESVARSALLGWCEARGHIPPGTFTIEAFDARLRLYERHFQLVRAYRPGVIAAPIAVWRAKSSRRPFDWSRHTRGTVIDDVVGGNHFSVMQSPHIDRVASDLEAGALRPAVP